MPYIHTYFFISYRNNFGVTKIIYNRLYTNKNFYWITYSIGTIANKLDRYLYTTV